MLNEYKELRRQSKLYTVSGQQGSCPQNISKYDIWKGVYVLPK